MAERAKITVRGIVQGVGFRPFVYNLADSLGLKGRVANTSDGVSIDIEGEAVPFFLKNLRAGAPELSRIDEISVFPLPVCGYADLRITESIDTGAFTLVSPDVSVCSDCLKELFDGSNRRYLYPFINCTNCGPRYSITRSMPYDRPNTTMSVFEMCPECSEEYNNPSDRRFHAQPNACAKCGPNLEFEIQDSGFRIQINENPLEAAVQLLKEGAIVAVKGIGGFHIACDAANEEAVKRLRGRKRKSNKPFALMASDTNAVMEFCEVSDEEKKLLESRRRPIVLLKKRGGILPEALSPNNRYFGFVLPYSPLHYLLFYHPLAPQSSVLSPHFKALVMTSGNLSEEPIIIDNETALKKLSGVADAFLLHNRDIFMGVDDSVIKASGNKPQVMTKGRDPELPTPNSQLRTHHASLSFIRRSRGYAPEPINIHSEGHEVMGCGADLKNTFTLTRGSFAIQSQHIGDMENYESLKFFEKSLGNIKSVFRVSPVAIAYDLHPNYLSTKWALRQLSAISNQQSEMQDAEKPGIKDPSRATRHASLSFYGIQHHYAHIGSVMAEHGLRDKVIGVAFDGTGYGLDGNLWGGEFLVADINGFERFGHLRYVPMPGGESAVREPWKTALSHILSASGDEAIEWIEKIGFLNKYGRDNIEKVMKISAVREFSPFSSGAGRLFDAVAAILGVCDRNTFEGEAAMALESLAIEGIEGCYPYDVTDNENGSEGFVIDFSRTIINIIMDIDGGADKHEISARFHNTISDAILNGVKRIARARALNDVALSGGTFQNLRLLRRSLKMLESAGMNVFINEQAPCNDAGISLGQAYIARERMKRA